VTPIKGMQRRAFLGGLLGLAGLTLLPSRSFAKAPGSRLILLMLEGAVDGLALCPPHADPNYAHARGHLALPSPERPDGVVDLDGFFGLHPSLAALAALYDSGELGVVHATGQPGSRRSHFEAMDMLQGGGPKPHSTRTGWLGRALGAAGSAGLAIGNQVPLILQGPAEIGSIDLQRDLSSDQDFLQVMATLYQGDPTLGPAYQEGLELRSELAEQGVMTRPKRSDHGLSRGLALQLGQILAKEDGPQAAVVQLGGWDTHTNQTRRLDSGFSKLAESLLALKEGLGPRWQNTLVLGLTEFGRSVRGNGTKGSDHGSASATLFAGGAVLGGQVMGPWPGLAQLYQDRDLAVGTDIRDVLAGALVHHLGLADLSTVFPESQPSPLRLVR
jgi:uncharacterized protein (DUF1501 family)